MKRNNAYFQIIMIIFISLLEGYVNGQDLNPCKTGGQTCYFGVEINGILCGYSVETFCDGILEGRSVRYENSDVTLKMSLLETGVDMQIKSCYTLDKASDRALMIDFSYITGQSAITSKTSIRNDTAYHRNVSTGATKVIPLNNDVIITSQTTYPHLFRDFIKKGLSEKKYQVYEPLRGDLVEKGYTRKTEEDITINDSIIHALVLEETDYSSGIKTVLWLDKKDGFNVKAELAGRSIYLADKSVMGRIRIVDMNDVMFAKVNKIIPNFIDMTWLKVRAEINSYGENLTPDKLNFRGQKFTGTVTGNLIEGIFEIEPVSYTGKNAPSFPPDFRKATELTKYLEPEMMIESDDPLIISEAVKITSGSNDSWEAAVRLSKWVAENIAGALPGGQTAINTLRMHEAECGGHSRLLAAFCRAVGIPARLSVGCMYTSNYKGSFGQHAWTEVYMGDAGWIPVDATIFETDYIDAGHIRLGEKATFQPVTMEILDYRCGSTETEAFIPDTFRPMIGNYMNIEQYRIFKIVHNDGGLAIDIPGQIILALNPPDDQGKWYPKLTRELSLTVGKNEEGKIDKMIMHQYARLRKMSAPDTGLNEIPEELRKFTGNYQFAPAKLSLDVMFHDGVLTTQEPLGRSKERISYSKVDNTWIDKTGNYEIGFTPDSENVIIGMILAVKTEFLRGEPVTNAIEPVVNDSGVDAGLKRYDQIKNSGKSEYLFSEKMLHNLGHNLLNENRIDDAIKIFLKNVQEYPGSFLANDALAEAYLKKGENRLAIKYLKIAVKLNPDYEYGRKMIEELRNK
jgi:hypothetical protein